MGLHIYTPRFCVEIIDNYTLAASLPARMEKVQLLPDLLARSYLQLGLFIFLVLYLSWRLWRFTIIPMIRPHDPKEVPYLIPCR